MIQSSIEVILSDLGNVILPFNHYQIPEKLARFSLEKEQADSSKIFSYLFDLRIGIVDAYETGKLSSMGFYQSVKDFFNLQISFEEFVPIWNDIFTENHEVSELLRSFKGKKRLGLVSNTNPLHFNYALARFPVLHVFDEWFLSHRVGFKKPAVEIFQRAMDWAAVGPERIVFIDDHERNVRAAVSLGMHGVHFTSYQQLKEELDRRLSST
jgi:FMN phosphatase YigB (HAD superfamily)